jgi:hypothetical protein
MITEVDIDFVKFCAKNEADKALETLDVLLSTLRLLHYHNSDRYHTLSAALAELKIINMFGIEVFENSDEVNGEW